MLQQVILPCLMLAIAKAADDDYYPTWDTTDTLDVFDYILFILSFILIIAGVVVQCCGFDLAGISLTMVGVICWIAELSMNSKSNKLWLIIPILLFLLLLPCWVAFYLGQKPADFIMGSGSSDRYSSPPTRDPPIDSAPVDSGGPTSHLVRGETERTPLISQREEASPVGEDTNV